MSDWRYWITYEGIVEARDEIEARDAARSDHEDGKFPASIEVEEVGEGE